MFLAKSTQARLTVVCDGDITTDFDFEFERKSLDDISDAAILKEVQDNKYDCGHALASRRKIQAREQVNIDISGVYERYHANGGRAFFVGQPPPDVLDFHRLSAGVFDLINSIMRPNLPVAELVIVEA